MNPISHICCFENSTLVDVLNIYEIANNYSLPSGIALIIDTNTKSLLGTITEGDMRRSLLVNNNLKISAFEVMNKNPIIFNESSSISEIINNLKLDYNLILINLNGTFKRRKSSCLFICTNS